MKLFVFAALFVCAVAEMEIKLEGNNFMYSTGDVGAHKREQTSESDGSVSGSYSYVDPNGDLRTVNYKAGPGIGYQASGDISVDKKTSEEAAKIAALAPKAPEPVELKAPVSPFTIPAPFYSAGIFPTHGHLHAPLPLAYNHLPLTYNALPYGLVGRQWIF